MGLRQRIWAAKRRAELIEALGGKCVQCGSVEDLQIDHINGRDWAVERVEWSWRISIYWAEYRAGVKLQCLCGDCNTRKSNPPGIIQRSLYAEPF
jgi:5-methylcytosine-specific restriction endonuclease McrA